MSQRKDINSIETTSFYNDTTLVEEISPTRSLLKFLYTTRLGHLVRFAMARRWWARFVGYYNNSRWSRRHIKQFIDAYNINMDDYELPAGGYTSFNDFFIRKLKKHARTFDSNPHIIVSPADSKLYVMENIQPRTSFFVKQTVLDIETFLGGKELADYYRHGTLLVFRLAPYDYHRFHFPINCTPTPPYPINGKLESVDPLVYKAGVQSLTTNERHLILLQTSRFQNVAMVAVGAMMVGKIIQTYPPNEPRRKGDECGYFCFGGSTVVLVFQHNAIRIKPSFLQHSLQGYETAVKMGESITY